MSELPETLERERHLDLEKRRLEIWVRRGGILVLLAILAVALAGVFGQSGWTAKASGTAASIRVDAPEGLRSGLMYQGRSGSTPIAASSGRFSSSRTAGSTG